MDLSAANCFADMYMMRQPLFKGVFRGNAGLFSNANDLAKVLQLMLNQGTYGGERYLSLEPAVCLHKARARLAVEG